MLLGVKVTRAIGMDSVAQGNVTKDGMSCMVTVNKNYRFYKTAFKGYTKMQKSKS